MIRRCTLFVMAWFFVQSVCAIIVVTPTDPMISNPAVHYLEDFSNDMGAFYSQHPGNGVWSVQNGKLVVNGVGSGPSIIVAPESTNRNYIGRSIHCNVTVNEFGQSAMIVFGYSRDRLGNDYFLCAGVYKGRWAIGYYPNEETGDFALLKAYDYGVSIDPMYHWTSLNVENPSGTNGYGVAYHVRLDISGNTVGLFVNNSELPYLKFSYDLISSGAIGLLATDSGSTDIIFDNFKVTDLARNTPEEIAAVPYEQNFNDPLTALQDIRFSHRNNWRIEVSDSGNGNLIIEDLPAPYKTAIAAFEGVILGNNIQLECTITLLDENADVCIFMPIRGMTGQAAGWFGKKMMYIGELSRYSETHAYLDYNGIWGYQEHNLQTNIPYNVILRYTNGLLQLLVNGKEVKRNVYANDMLPAEINNNLKQMVGVGYAVFQTPPYHGAKFDNFRVTNLSNDWIPTSADLDLTSLELKKSTNSIIDKLIDQYDSDPRLLYQYLINNIESLPNWYDGSLRRGSDREKIFYSNAESTLWRKCGSSAGQCFALMSFLRTLNIPCRLIGGAVTMHAVDWNRLYNEEVHTYDGTPVDPMLSFSRDKYWVEAMINGEKVSLFPWLNFYETVNDSKLRLEDVLWAPSSNFPNRIGTWPDDLEEEPVCVELIRKMIDQNSEFFPKNVTGNLVWGTDQPIPILKNYIRNYLESIGSSYSLDHVGTLRKLQPTRVTDFRIRPLEILNAQPCTIITNIGTQLSSTEPFSVCRAKFKLRIEDTVSNGYMEKEFYAYDLLNERIVLTFIPYGQYWAIPTLKINGSSSAAWAGSYPTYGTDHKIKCSWYLLDVSENVWGVIASQKFRVGDVVNCFMDTGGVSDEMVDECYQQIRPIVQELGTNSPPVEIADSNFESYWGSLLHLVQVKWSGYIHNEMLEAEKLLSVNQKLYYKSGFTTWNIEHDGTSYFMGGISIDQSSGAGSYNPISLSKDVCFGRSDDNFRHLYQIISSSYEHQVFEDVLGSKTAGSTFKYLRQAQEQGGAVREIKGFADFDANRTQIQSELSALEGDYGTTLDLYSDFEQHFANSPYGYAWYPTISVTGLNIRAVGWLLGSGADTNGNYFSSPLGGQWIHTTFMP